MVLSSLFLVGPFYPGAGGKSSEPGLLLAGTDVNFQLHPLFWLFLGTFSTV